MLIVKEKCVSMLHIFYLEGKKIFRLCVVCGKLNDIFDLIRLSETPLARFAHQNCQFQAIVEAVTKDYIAFINPQWLVHNMKFSCETTTLPLFPCGWSWRHKLLKANLTTGDLKSCSL